MKTQPFMALAAACALALPCWNSQAQDAAAGKAVFAQCTACHAVDAKNGAGPGLKGIVGRTAGSAAGFHYSPSMTQAGFHWDAQSLNAFIENPQRKVPGNVMPFAGLPDAKQRADLLAYLQTLN